MLDPGKYFAEAIYFVMYTFAELLWAVNRALLSIAIIAEALSSWISANIGYFVQLLVNALSAPLGGMLILALTALGCWYTLNSVVATERWVDPSKLLTYGLLALFFFSAPLLVINALEDIRLALQAGIDPALIDAATGDIFSASMDGTDVGLGNVIPDVNSDGFLGSFDLVTAFLSVATLDELDSTEFPATFELTYFPFGDPSGINLADEADRELAKALAGSGIERLFFALIAIPTAIAEALLQLVLTGVAMLLYAGVPFALLFAFFVYTQAFLGLYLRQFINLLIETLFSVIIVSLMIALLAIAAQQGIGLYIGASVIALIVLTWRIVSALKLAGAAFDLFGGSTITGGASGRELGRIGGNMLTGTASVAGAALTGGATVALGGAALAAASAMRMRPQGEGEEAARNSARREGRARQLQTVAGYTLGKSETSRRVIEGAHELRTLGRSLRSGTDQPQAPDTLDYLRTGSSMSGFGSRPWLAMRLSPSLRTAYDQIGGTTGDSGHPLTGSRSEDGSPVSNGTLRTSNGVRRTASTTNSELQAGIDPTLLTRFDSLEQALVNLTAALAAGPGNGNSVGSQPPESNSEQQTPTIVQDVNVVAVAPDLDRDGQDDRNAIRPNTTNTTTTPAIQFEPQTPQRTAQIQTLLRDLAQPNSLGAQQARQTLTTFAGDTNTATLSQAVGQHSAETVTAASEGIEALVERYRGQGVIDADILTAFQSGEATTALRAQIPTPLNGTQLAAVADMVLLPQRQVSRSELVLAIQSQTAEETPSAQGIAQTLGSPVGFGGQTGTVRGVLAGSQAFNLSPAEIQQIAHLIQQGLREQAVAILQARGQSEAAASTFVADVAALPEAITLPQTTAGLVDNTRGER